MPINSSQQISLSRILPPHLNEVVERPRLIESLAGNQDKKLTLILGQPAQGKSTLAACYAKKCGIATAWVNLGREDSEAINLYLLLNHSLIYALTEAKGVSPAYCPPPPGSI